MMDNKEFDLVVAKTIESIQQLLKSKGAEYAGEKDRLANFKRGAELTGVTPLQVAFVYASKHYDSLSTYITKDAQGYKQVLSEPIHGRLDDLINYCILMKALIIEAGQQPVKEGPFQEHRMKTEHELLAERRRLDPSWDEGRKEAEMKRAEQYIDEKLYPILGAAQTDQSPKESNSNDNSNSNGKLSPLFFTSTDPYSNPRSNAITRFLDRTNP